MKLKNFSRSVFNNISAAYPQNSETKLYLKKLKTNQIKNLGNLKFIENEEKNLIKIDIKLKKALQKKRIWVASSTHQGEELFCAKAHIELKKTVKNLITIIIPRHTHRVQEIISKINKLNLKISCHSSKVKSLKNTEIYIVDTFGETKKFHKISCSVFLGGSIIYRGGQNPLEAARYGCNIIHGPNISNFKEIYKFLKTNKASIKIFNEKTMINALNKFFLKETSSRKIHKKLKLIGQKILNNTYKEIVLR